MGMFDDFEEQKDFSVREILKNYNIQWKSKEIDEIVSCPFCNKHFKRKSEDGLEDLIFTLDPNLVDVYEDMIITKEMYEIICSILMNDGLARKR